MSLIIYPSFSYLLIKSRTPPLLNYLKVGLKSYLVGFLALFCLLSLFYFFEDLFFDLLLDLIGDLLLDLLGDLDFFLDF